MNDVNMNITIPESDSLGRRWHPAPYQTVPTHSGSMLGVYLADDEEVEWLWTGGLNGSYVMGYTVKKRQPLEKFTVPRENINEQSQLG